VRKRILTGFLLTLILLPIAVINNPIVFFLFQAIVIAFVVIATYEMLTMFEKEKPIRLRTKIIILALTLINYFNVGGLVGPLEPETFPGLILLTINIHPIITIALTVIIILLVFVLDDEFTINDVGKAFIIINYVGLGASAITMLRYLGVRFIFYVLLISTLTDMFAYFIGMIFGKRRLAPKISPKKSWEGAIGGAVIATLVASGFALFYGFIFTPEGFLGDILNPSGYLTIFDNFSSISNEPFALQAVIIIPITLLGSIFSQMGDLIASKFKRNYEIKDFGKIFPGHGGVLDRFDSILFIGLLFLGIFIFINSVFPL